MLTSHGPTAPPCPAPSRQIQLNLFPMAWPGYGGQPRPVGDRTAGLTQRQVAVLAALQASSGRLLTMRELAEAAGLVSDEAARAITKRLRARSLLAVTQVRGCRQGFVAEVLLTDEEWASRIGQHVRSLAQESAPDRTPVRTVHAPERPNVRTEVSTGKASRPTTAPTPPTGLIRTVSWPPVRTPRPPGVRTKSSNHGGSLAASGPRQPDERPDAAPLEKRKESKNSVHSFSQTLKTMSQEEFAAFWPNLARIGLGVAKAREIVQRREQSHASCDELRMGLEFADAAVELGLERMAAGGVVGNELAYVYAALLRNGYFDRPPGYLTGKERALRDARSMEESMEADTKAIEHIRFTRWSSDLTPEALKALRESNPANRCMPQEVMLRLEWARLGKPEPADSREAA